MFLTVHTAKLLLKLIREGQLRMEWLSETYLVLVDMFLFFCGTLPSNPLTIFVKCTIKKRHQHPPLKVHYCSVNSCKSSDKAENIGYFKSVFQLVDRHLVNRFF